MDQLLPYLLAVIGFLIVHVLNGIKGEIKEGDVVSIGLADGQLTFKAK